MPIYEYFCHECGEYKDEYRMIANRDDVPECHGKMQRINSSPSMVMGDIEPYQSMCDGTMVMGRMQHRDHLKRHNVIEIGNEKIKPGVRIDRKQIRSDLVASLNQAKEKYGSRKIESSISDALNKAHQFHKR